MIVLKL